MHVVVTGASSGIGLDLARAFARPGHRLSLVARRRNLLEELGAGLAVENQVIVADMADAADPIGWLTRAEATFGPTDILINNAGTSYVEPVLGVDAARIQALFQINVHTPIAAIHHVLPAMVQRRQGVIVNVASTAAFAPAPYFCHYSATKAALGSFSECLRMEVKNSGVHVVTVYPGPVKTPMGDRNWGQLKSTAASRLTPVGDTTTLAGLVLAAVTGKKAR
jgi:short-subunit dehydrogenase